MPKHGKNFRKVTESITTQAAFSVTDAVTKAISSAYAKFDETVDVALRLGVDPK